MKEEENEENQLAERIPAAGEAGGGAVGRTGVGGWMRARILATIAKYSSISLASWLRQSAKYLSSLSRLVSASYARKL